LSHYSIDLPENCTNEEYEAKMNTAMLAYKARGIRTIAFGDLFLEGIRRYRQGNLSLDKQCAGLEIDADFLSDLPAGVDPCGENGEYHSFVFDGPLFKAPIDFEAGEKVLKRDQFYYCDLV